MSATVAARRVPTGVPATTQDPGKEKRKQPPARRKPATGMPRFFPLAMMFIISIALLGIPYFTATIHERVRHPYHDFFKPSGWIGQSAGVVSFLLFLFLWLYPLRKRVRWLNWSGGVGRWLDFHVAAGLVIPLLGAIHAAFRFNGLIGLGYGAMFVVCVSGFVGKYVYARIPRAKSGLELSRKEIETRRQESLATLSRDTGMAVETLRTILSPTNVEQNLSRGAAAMQLIRDDFQRRSAVRALARQWRRANPGGGRLDRRALRRVRRMAQREMALAQQMRMLDATQKVFKFWHAAHLPVAITALIAVSFHVVLVVSLGSTWFW